ncbi:MAG: alpha/beta hydrolase-fold protein [Bdellovibrio sp.]
MAKSIIVNVPWWSQGEIFITGSSRELCHWKPDCKKLNQIGPHTYKIELEDFLNEFEFKITRGDWRKEGVSSFGEPIDNFKGTVSEEDQVISIENWSDSKPLVENGIFNSFDIFSNQLKRNKKIRVFLPPNYDRFKSKRYPVLYMHDGQNLFDSRIGNFGMEWGVDETLNDLYIEKRVEEYIIVGIDSNEFRTQEYNFNLEGEKYAAFIVETLKPYIDQKYRTKTDRQNTFISGSSYGAIISFQTLWKYSNVFSKAICLSFPAHAQNLFVFDFIKKYPIQNSDVYFYIDHGLIGGDRNYYQHTSLFVKELRDLGFDSLKLDYQLYPFADHREVDWARRLPEIFKIVL